MGAFGEMLRRFFRNIRYIRKIDLRKAIPYTYEEQLENFLYYIPNSSVARPKVYTEEESVDKLVASAYSLARFGDGELALIAGRRIPFQKYDAVLSRRLKEAMQSNDQNLLLAINRNYYYPVYSPKDNSYSNDFNIYALPKHRKVQNSIIDFDKEFLDASFTLPAGSNTSLSVSKERYDAKMSIFKKLRTIWSAKNIVIVTCKELVSNITYNIFDNAKNISYVFTPPMHAFSEYQRIYNDIVLFPVDTLIILMAGPTSKILAVDLTAQGYRALDLGHLMKSYDFMMKEGVLTPEKSKKFWAADL